MGAGKWKDKWGWVGKPKAVSPLPLEHRQWCCALTMGLSLIIGIYKRKISQLELDIEKHRFVHSVVI